MLLTLAMLIACDGDKSEATPLSVDDACPEVDDYGDDDASDDAKAAFDRSACYRELLGLNLGELDARLNASAQAHADYMKSKNTLDHQESDSGNANYTGEWVWDRAEAAGYAFTAGMAMAETLSYGTEPADSVDGWMNSVYHRIPFTMSEWTAVGYGQTGMYSAMTFVTPYPDPQDIAVIYPIDGQIDVPAIFNSDEEWPDPAPDTSMVGPPITVTVGSTSGTSSYTNPYDLQLDGASLEGPDGEIALIELVPDEDPYLGYAVALVPEEPLEYGATYTAEVSVSWSGGEETLTATFTTTE